jgi:hypothetical protein
MSQVDAGQSVQVAPSSAGAAGSSVSRVLLYFAAALPALVPLWMVLHYGTDMPYWDQWFPDIAGIYIKAAQHTLRFSDFAAQHNEHRILIPRLIYFGLNRLTHWNTIVEMLAGWGVVVLTSLSLLRLIRLTHGEARSDGALSGHRDMLLWLLCNVVLFSTVQGRELALGDRVDELSTGAAAGVVAADCDPAARWNLDANLWRGPLLRRSDVFGGAGICMLAACGDGAGVVGVRTRVAGKSASAADVGRGTGGLLGTVFRALREADAAPGRSTTRERRFAHSVLLCVPGQLLRRNHWHCVDRNRNNLWHRAVPDVGRGGGVLPAELASWPRR